MFEIANSHGMATYPMTSVIDIEIRLDRKILDFKSINYLLCKLEVILIEYSSTYHGLTIPFKIFLNLIESQYCYSCLKYQPFRIGKRMCIKSVTSFVKIFSSVSYKIFYFISLNIFLLYKTPVATDHCLFLSSLSITDDIFSSTADSERLFQNFFNLHNRLRSAKHIDRVGRKSMCLCWMSVPIKTFLKSHLTSLNRNHIEDGKAYTFVKVDSLLFQVWHSKSTDKEGKIFCKRS